MDNYPIFLKPEEVVKQIMNDCPNMSKEVAKQYAVEVLGVSECKL